MISVLKVRRLSKNRQDVLDCKLPTCCTFLCSMCAIVLCIKAVLNSSFCDAWQKVSQASTVLQQAATQGGLILATNSYWQISRVFFHTNVRKVNSSTNIAWRVLSSAVNYFFRNNNNKAWACSDFSPRPAWLLRQASIWDRLMSLYHVLFLRFKMKLWAVFHSTHCSEHTLVVFLAAPYSSLEMPTNSASMYKVWADGAACGCFFSSIEGFFVLQDRFPNNPSQRFIIKCYHETTKAHFPCTTYKLYAILLYLPWSRIEVVSCSVAGKEL